MLLHNFPTIEDHIQINEFIADHNNPVFKIYQNYPNTSTLLSPSLYFPSPSQT